uniref:Cip1-like core domain-containing protein n=1 Tax=Bionectria ochroleuca TaxID=29856 RepID=A0A8H7K9W9_BIOOC
MMPPFQLYPPGDRSLKALPTGDFQCLEYHLGTDGTIETWLNSESIAGLQAGPNANNSNADQWESAGYKPAITGIYFGWESYSGDINTFWYDDISIGSSRVGCGATDNSGQTTTSVSEAPKTTLATSTKAASTPAGVTTTSKASETVPTTSVETSEPSSVSQSAVLSSTATPSSTVPDSTTSTSTSASSTPTRKCSKNKKRRNHYK